MNSPELTVLGSGGFAPADDGREVRNPSGYALALPSGDSVLLDFGFGNLRQYARAGLKMERIKYVLLSHFHLDHWGDLPALLFVFHYNIKPLGGRLTIAGPEGTKKLLGGQMAVSRYMEPSGYELEIAEFRPGEKKDFGEFSADCFKVDHTPEALAYRLTTGGKTLAYTGDAKPTPGLAAFCAGADLLIADAGLRNSLPHKPHMTVSQACELAREAAPRLTLLSHLSPDAAPEAQAAAAQSGGKLAAASDLLRLRL
ncbi:MAG: MBL fold metallo-hydrolase [Elusimicrobia bacterium]|nr:MBL fold metallo-hydrolase [Elusimicrobiota bacterium]